MPELKEENLNGFDSPTALPQSLEQASHWQTANRQWWNSHPMRYDWGEKVAPEEFSREFYEEIDRRFFSNAETYLPSKKIPFDRLIDFESLKDKAVLEIGVGNGSHAGLLAKYARSFTGIDITDYAVKSTSLRMPQFGLNGHIIQMDAEHMEFADNSFDYIWTWGVIHHSSDTRKVLAEMQRVLKPGGQATVMVYHRNFWNWYIFNGLFIGILRRGLRRTRSVHGVVQGWTDGAIARYYTIPEWRALTSQFFSVERISVYGAKAEIVPLPACKFKNSVMRVIPDSVSRMFTNRMRWGVFLVSVLSKSEMRS